MGLYFAKIPSPGEPGDLRAINKGPPEATKDLSHKGSDNCASKINYDLVGIDGSKTDSLTSTSMEGDVNAIEVIGNSDETEKDDEIRDFPIGLTDSPVCGSSSGRLRTVVTDNTHSENTISKDHIDHGNQNINRDLSRLDAINSADGRRESPELISGDYWFYDQGQFVNCKLVYSLLDVVYSCQFRCDCCTVYIRKQENEYLLTIDEHRFIARVAIDLLNGAYFLRFDSLKQIILAAIRVIRVVEDELLEERDLSVTRFTLKVTETVTNEVSDQSTQVLLLGLESIKDKDPLIGLKHLSMNSSLPVDLRSASGDLLEKEMELLSRNKAINFHQTPPCETTMNVIKLFYSKGIERHQKQLIDYCPPALPRLRYIVENISPQVFLFVSRADIGVFHHLLTITNEPDILPFFEFLLENFIERVKNINPRSSFANETPLVNPILGFLFKSFWEIMSDIRRIVGTCSYRDLLIQRGKHWRIIDLINWPVLANGERHPTQHVNRSLECQFKFVFRLMKHFQPNGPWKTSRFKYQMQLYSKKQSWWKKVIPKVRQDCNTRLKHLTEERKIWLYIMDHAIEQVVIDQICSFEEFFNFYEPLMKFHRKFVSNSTTESLESFRLVTHNILRYIVQTSTFFIESDIDAVVQDILSRQMSYLTQMVEDSVNDESSFTFFGGLIDEYNKFWDLHLALGSKYREIPDFLADQLDESVNIIFQMVRDALGISAPIKALSEFLSRINEFVADYQNMAFESTWYVKSKNPDHSGLTKVLNKIAGEIDCSYLVTDLNDYLNSIGDSERPPHYNIRILRKLIDCVNLVFEKSWGDDELPVVARFDATSTLLGAITSSLVYLKEQPDYRDFTKYEKDSTELFVRAVNTCPDLQSFKTRVGVIIESWWYFRKKDEIGVDRALEMLESMFGDTIEKTLLKSGYFRYANKFLEHVENSASQDSTNDKIHQIFDDLKSHIVDHSVEKWEGSFKTETVPEILAGLSAIWSLMKSKDVTTGENLLQPHCIQILCALRLLAVDRECAGANNHLAQILTGQGKSVVLALVAAVFALTGHKVFIVCYNRYLVNRDDFEFEPFFTALHLTEKVKYITIRQLAEECMKPTIDGAKLCLRTCLKNHILQRTPLPNLATATFNFSNTILLVDEVDVFFSENVYGSRMSPVFSFTVPGLAEVQEYMWTEVTSAVHTTDELLEKTEKYIKRKIQSKDTVITELCSFRDRAGSFRVLEDEEGRLVEKHYSSNQDFFRKHLREMAINAINVSKTDSTIQDNMINEYGLICQKDNIDGVYSPVYIGYNMCFSYFKLKSRDFDCKNGRNYGYLYGCAGRVSYAKLPTDFLLVLGVTGTLRNVYDHEKKAMREFYNIVNYTDCPSFYGSSIVKFNPESDFTVLESVNQWRRVLFEQAYSQIQLGRAVMIFFAHENEISSFVREFGNKFATLNVLTENTESESKKLFIDRAGAPATLTLASCGIGRGTDFKSSLGVERNGGVHVIQPFFSIDQKQEIQIRGRTARRDNKGSYELILCRQHLIEAKLLDEVDSTTVTYSQLDESRTKLMEGQGAEIAEEIEGHYIDHATTMKFYGLE